jgi:hypothetical protein
LENIDFLDGGIKQAAVTMLQRLYPEKGSHLGEDTLRLVVRRGFDVADRYGIGSNKGCFLVSGLLYCFGHGIANDALYPWVADSLCCPAPHGVDDKVQRLYQKASVYLERMLRHLE